jgi:lysophospholipase L1-like esterase
VWGLSQLAQLAELRSSGHVDVAFVLLSIGGNDALFGSIARTCVLPGDCSDLGGAWLDHLAQVEGTIKESYGELRAALPDVPVVVVPYPIPLADDRCGYSPFSRNEHRFLQRFTRELDELLRRTAATVGFHYVDTMPDALAGRRVCDDRAGRIGVNVFAANGVSGLTEEVMNPANWFHNSMHPNQRGHAAMRATLLRWLEDHRPLAPRATSSNDPVRDVIGIEDVVRDAGDSCRGVVDVEDCTNDWMLARTSALLLTRGWLLLLCVLGAWLFALQVVRAYRKRTRHCPRRR